MVSSPSPEVPWILYEQKRILRCDQAEIWVEYTRHASILWLREEELY